MDGDDNERMNFEVDAQHIPISQPSQETVPTIELANTIKSEPRVRFRELMKCTIAMLIFASSVELKDGAHSFSLQLAWLKVRYVEK
ncbi:hypothetical protein CFP56_041116 [Quercus suber]|uniref:Uncharacterized protein n=1 Tax=Quercus suber TaxID=58331 RepID=A0AAW0IWR2_QUESU